MSAAEVQKGLAIFDAVLSSLAAWRSDSHA
jgi:hypothetical protein